MSYNIDRRILNFIELVEGAHKMLILLGFYLLSYGRRVFTAPPLVFITHFPCFKYLFIV